MRQIYDISWKEGDRFGISVKLLMIFKFLLHFLSEYGTFLFSLY